MKTQSFHYSILTFYEVERIQKMFGGIRDKAVLDSFGRYLDPTVLNDLLILNNGSYKRKLLIDNGLFMQDIKINEEEKKNLFPVLSKHLIKNNGVDAKKEIEAFCKSAKVMECYFPVFLEFIRKKIIEDKVIYSGDFKGFHSEMFETFLKIRKEISE